MDIKTENWTITEDDGGECLDLGTDEGGFSVVNKGMWASREQMILASAAPDMARVLLANEWRCVDESTGNPCCPSCRAVVFVNIRVTKHLPTCALDMALRKAGLR